MAQREGSIYLSLFIVAMLLFVLSTVFFFVAYNKQEEFHQELIAERETVSDLEGTQRRLTEEITSLKTMIAGATNTEEIGSTQEDRDSYMKRELAVYESAINKAREYLGNSDAAKFTYLTEPSSLLEGLFTKLRDARDSAVQGHEVATKQIQEVQESSDSTKQLLTSQLEAKTAEYNDVQQKLEDSEGRAQTDRERLEQEKAELEDQKTDLEIEMAREKKRLTNQINTLLSKIAVLEKADRLERMFEELEPDGRLHKVVASLGKGWIDLGRRDHMMPGLVFQVFQIVKGGKKIHKGRIEVRRVDETSSEVRIIEENSALNPINDGDYIASPFYDKSERPIFVFAGQNLQTRSITKDFLVAKLKGYGVDLRKNVDINTTYLVALDKYEETTEYKTARELSIPLLREVDVLKFIGY